MAESDAIAALGPDLDMPPVSLLAVGNPLLTVLISNVIPYKDDTDLK